MAKEARIRFILLLPPLLGHGSQEEERASCNLNAKVAAARITRRRRAAKLTSLRGLESGKNSRQRRRSSTQMQKSLTSSGSGSWAIVRQVKLHICLAFPALPRARHFCLMQMQSDISFPGLQKYEIFIFALNSYE